MASTFAGLLKEIEDAALSAVAAIKNEVATVIVPEIEADVVMVLGQLKDLAIATVLEAAQMAITGEEKFGTVVTTVFQHAEANAIAVGIADVQMLVQQVYYSISKVLR